MHQSVHQMQRYVLGWTLLLIGFGATFPIALWRVSQTPKFTGQAVKSQNCSSQDFPNHQPVSWLADCATRK
jgi:hypothetical protein